MLKVTIASLFRLKETLRENMISFKSKYAYVEISNRKLVIVLGIGTNRLFYALFLSCTVIPQIYMFGGQCLYVNCQCVGLSFF